MLDCVLQDEFSGFSFSYKCVCWNDGLGAGPAPLRRLVQFRPGAGIDGHAVVHLPDRGDQRGAEHIQVTWMIPELRITLAAPALVTQRASA